MMRRVFILLVLVLLLGCAQESNVFVPESGTGEMPISLNLAPAFEQGLRISRVLVTITKDEFIESLELNVDGTNAHGTFTGLEPGEYQITVNIYEGDTIVATGTGSATIVENETATALINLEFVEPTGDLEIVVTWGEIPERILFIGNSYTYGNGGMDNILEQIVWGENPLAEIEIDAITGGGMTLQNHYNNQSTINSIMEGDYDVVILQEQSQMPYLDQATFFQYATLMDEVIDASGADTWFFMTWARQYEPPQIVELQSAYETIATTLNADVIPVGVAFDLVNMDHNQPLALNIYNSDQSHPSQEGSYLAGLCFYMRLFKQSPMNISWSFATTTDEYRTYLQQKAWDACFGYGN